MSATVAHASGSERSVFLPWQILLLILISVKFRVNPWQMLLLPSVASLLPFTNLHLKPNLFELNLVLC